MRSLKLKLEVGDHTLALAATFNPCKALLGDAGGEAAKHLASDWHPALDCQIVQLHLQAIMFCPEVIAWEVNGLHLVSPDVDHLAPNLLAKELSTSWTWHTDVTAQGLSKSR